MKYLQRKTKRLLIRPLELKDYKIWKSSNLQIAKSKNKWDRGPKPVEELTRDHFKKVLVRQKEHRNKDSFYDLAVFDSEGALVGVVAAMEVARGISQTAYLGYGIFNTHWGLGYGKEAVQAMLDIGFNDLKLHRLEAGIEPGNTRSLRLAKSLGMRREGRKKSALFLRNTWVDLIMYTLTSEDLRIQFEASGLSQRPRS
jgi:ribosomal-protein-alanine N-acetyltransferase